MIRGVIHVLIFQHGKVRFDYLDPPSLDFPAIVVRCKAQFSTGTRAHETVGSVVLFTKIFKT
uniref:Uncharacterized protein n=1 Tax=Anguilla anguilla TaxID=7936 RepID=A0A0E9Q0I6_ANGAN